MAKNPDRAIEINTLVGGIIMQIWGFPCHIPSSGEKKKIFFLATIKKRVNEWKEKAAWTVTYPYKITKKKLSWNKRTAGPFTASNPIAKNPIPHRGFSLKSYNRDI